MWDRSVRWEIRLDDVMVIGWIILYLRRKGGYVSDLKGINVFLWILFLN